MQGSKLLALSDLAQKQQTSAQGPKIEAKFIFSWILKGNWNIKTHF